VKYKKVEDGYELDLVRGWEGIPELSYPPEFWHGLGLRKTNVGGLDAKPAGAAAAASMDSVREFLLTSAANDFHSHRPQDPVRFRDVRIGHVMNPTGEEQYVLCGQFLPAGSKAEWTPFATIKTSGYEQWIGAQAADFCQGSSVIWDEVGDLSSSLQSRLDSLR
jgi:hypothetical protein